MKSQSVESNLWKYFFYALSQRRNFFPLLSIFFLTLPNTTAKQIGFYVGVGSLASFFLEIPSGYISDKIGHKNTLIFAKFCMVVSMSCFVFGQNFLFFIFGSMFISISFAFESGAKQVFLHETLLQLRKDKEYAKIVGRIKGNVSLFSFFIIVLLPFFTKVNLLLPFQISLIIDLLGFCVALSFVDPRKKLRSDKTALLETSFFSVIKEAFKSGFFPLAIFSGAITGFMVGDSAFRSIYLESLGYPIFLIGFVMGFSRIIWFFVGRNLHWFEKISFSQHLLLEVILFPLYYFAVAFFSNPYMVGLIFSLILGYQWARLPIFTQRFLKYHVKSKKYKATLLSIVDQISSIGRFSSAFAIGFIMNYSYKLGFLLLGVTLFLILLFCFYRIRVKIKK